MMSVQEILEKIKEFGLNESQIAKGSGVPQPTINRLCNGKAIDCRFKNYTKIKNFHDEMAKTKTPNVHALGATNLVGKD